MHVLRQWCGSFIVATSVCLICAGVASAADGPALTKEQIKNFLLTGRPGIGKTTVAEAIIREFEEDAGGFVTGEIRESGTRKGFRITATLKSLRS